MIACHADHIGSLLRPSELIPAREEAAAGRISRARFKAIEDRAVKDAIRLQEGVGLPVSPTASSGGSPSKASSPNP
jgi:Methionine synthase II (cobalamin-independent)